jgi:hypothetical protein
MREQIKKQLIEALETGTQESSIQLTSEQLAIEIENNVFESKGKNSKDKLYRDRTKKIISRIKGTRNQIVRTVLKTGVFTVDDLSNMTDKELENDNYFNKFNKGDENVNKGKIINAKPPKINIPIVPIDFNKGNNF